MRFVAKQKCVLVSNSAPLWRTATVVRQRRDVFDRFDGQASSLERRDGAFAATTRAVHANFDFLHAEFRSLLGTLLRGHLPGKRRAFARALETSRAGAGPAQGVTFRVRDRDRRIVERRADVGDAYCYITPRFPFG